MELGFVVVVPALEEPPVVVTPEVVLVTELVFPLESVVIKLDDSDDLVLVVLVIPVELPLGMKEDV